MFLDGDLASERWLTVGPHTLAAAIARVAKTGIVAEGRWLIEIYDPAAPGDRAYVRFGPGGPSAAIMTAGPVPVDFTLLGSGPVKAASRPATALLRSLARFARVPCGKAERPRR